MPAWIILDVCDVESWKQKYHFNTFWYFSMIVSDRKSNIISQPINYNLIMSCTCIYLEQYIFLTLS